MFESKYSKVLTIILIIVILAIVALLGFLAYDYYQKYIITKDTSEFVDNFQNDISEEPSLPTASEPIENENNEENEENSDPFGNIQATETGNASSTVQTYQGFRVVGTIEIPAISIKYPILEKVTKRSIEVAVAFLWGAGINQPGNSVIIGHNYRNGLFFSNIKKLQNGDKIYITDTEGNKVTYTVYNKFEAGDTDTKFYQRNTDGKPEITLSTCTENVQTRMIILAKAD